jgi:hypothetical protein
LKKRQELIEQHEKELAKKLLEIEGIDLVRPDLDNLSKSVKSITLVRKLDAEKVKLLDDVAELKVLIADLKNDNADEKPIS